MYSDVEIQARALGQLTPEQLNAARAAVHGFETLFGRRWVDAHFGPAMSLGRVLSLVDIWNDWSVVAPLQGSGNLADRWRSGISAAGVHAEVAVMARLSRAGATVELEPKIGGRVPDCRFQLETGNRWVYVEVSRRAISEIRERAQHVLTRCAPAVAQAAPGMHGKLAVLRMPVTGGSELDALVDWLRPGLPDGTRFRDLAVFYTDAHACAVDDADRMSQQVPPPRMTCTQVGFGDGTKGSATVGVSDEGAQEVLKTEAAQLPRGEPGVVVLDLSAVIRGCEEWQPLIRRRFQPTINTRLGGVALFETVGTATGLRSRGRLLLNPHAQDPLSPAEGEVVESVVTHG